MLLGASLAFVGLGCGDDGGGGTGDGGDGSVGSGAGGPTGSGSGAGSSGQGGSGAGSTGSGGQGQGGSTNPIEGPPAGNPYPEATCSIPAGAGEEDVSSPKTVVGDGTPQSCTSAATVAAIADGGVITFDCGPDPITIELDETAKIFNDKGPKIVIDGGGLVTLSGKGQRRILYMNTCDPDQVWTTSHCDNQDHPQLTLQNLTFVDGNSKSETQYDGGGAVWARGGRLKIVNSRFFNNVCADVGPDLGGAGVRALSQFDGLPVFVVNSTFGGEDGYGNTCSNGGGISSIGVSWTIVNSLFSYNHAIGNGGNPAQSGTPGGGSGGAIYNDGNTMTLDLCGTRLEHNDVVQHGSGIFFVSNNHTGDVQIQSSNITNNQGGSWYPTYPQISGHADTPIVVGSSTIGDQVIP
ncbi:MAG: hypothetical protein KC731_02515 [Myxococcales bacterium]|nr:hypothetical protein [Myxococcales bacterium]